MQILERPENGGEDLDKVCKAVFDEVRRDGDEALRKYTWYFDRVKLERLEVTEEEFQEAESVVAVSYTHLSYVYLFNREQR